MITQGLSQRLADSEVLATNRVQLQPRMRALKANRETDDSDEERELTNLNWLLRNQSLKWPKTIDTNAEDDENIVLIGFSNLVGANEGQQRKQSSSNSSQEPVKKSCLDAIAIPVPRKQSMPQNSALKRPTPAERFEIFLNKIKRDLADYEKCAANYETDMTEKPPFNYSHIIGMAMLENGRVTLQQICAWIESKFAFFRVRKKWNNSIRHNLSLHHCFRKIDRKREEKGKGGYWELGVDPKKCDRKRIRNRKTQPKTKPNQSLRTAKTYCEHRCQSEETNIASSELGDGSYAYYVFDEPEPTISISASAGDDVPDEVQICYRQMDQPSMDLHGSQEDDASTAFLSCPDEVFPTILESVQQQYELGTIIISTTGIIDDAIISNKFNCPMIYAEDEVPAASENVIISSHVSLASTSDNLDSAAMLPPTISSSPDLPTAGSDSFPISTGGMTVSYDYSNFRPYMDGMDEESFHYLHSAELSRSEDILDNLLDVCTRDY